MEDKTLILVFPQWQGSGKTCHLFTGADIIQKNLLEGLEVVRIDVGLNQEITVQNDILGYADILHNLRKANRSIAAYPPDKIYTIGGDCGVEVAPVSYLNKKYGGDLAIVWFDAHGDLNTPATSPSKLFHGMPLRFLLGEGERTILDCCSSQIAPGQILLVGTRELDPDEARYIKENKIKCVSCEALATDETKVINYIEELGYRNVYVHIDLDVLEPSIFPHVMCPTANGLAMEVLLRSIKNLQEKFNMVGFSIVEYVHHDDEGLEDIKEILKCGNMIDSLKILQDISI